MTKICGVGVIGAGDISKTYLKLAPLFKGLEIRAIADIAPEAARRRGEEFGVRAQAPDELLKDPEIDVIVNLTVPSAHYQVSLAALFAGKHVYSEKPFALSLEEGRSLKEAAQGRGLVVGSAPDTFLGGAPQQARDLIDSGAIGKVASGTAHVMGRGMEHWHPNPEFFFKPGGGPMLDMGPYYVTALVNLLGPVSRVTGFAGAARRSREVTAEGPFKGTTITVETPTTIHSVLEFHSGAIVSLGASWDVRSHGHGHMELYGVDGTIELPDPNFFGGEIVLGDRDGARSKPAAWDHPLGKGNQPAKAGGALANYRSAGLADMIAGLASGRPPRCGIDLALHAVDVMTSALKAGETGQAVTLATTCERPAALRPEEAAALLK
jgi:predicted dehydrogenase